MPQDLITVPGTFFPLIKPLVGFRSDIERQIANFPFEKNVFLMMRFREANRALADFIIETLQSAGLTGIRADDPAWNITNDVYNPIAVLYCCKYGIALFDEDEEGQAYNPNVIYELAMMHCLTRECLILRNDALPALPFDLIKNLYMPYKGELAVRTNVQRWLDRIVPGVSTERAAAKLKTGESRLELAAVAAPIVEGDRVVASPDDIATADFSWKVSAKTAKAWTVSWSIKLTNNRRDPASVSIQVLFLDENGFALEDHTSVTKRAISPRETMSHKAAVQMSPDLAGRIRRGIVTVSSIPKKNRKTRR
jgi:hypothetical protein